MANKNNELAVSPIVATLVLIVVAVIGAVAIGPVLGTFSTDVSKQASASPGRISSADRDHYCWITVCHSGRTGSCNGLPEVKSPVSRLTSRAAAHWKLLPSVAMGVADIGMAVNPTTLIPNFQTANPTDPTYQNFYITQVGGRGIVFIQDQRCRGFTNNIVAASDIYTLYSNVARDGTEKGVAND